MDLLQMLPSGQRGLSGQLSRAQEDISDLARRVRSGEYRTSDPDRWSDRLVPQVFAARITASTAKTPLATSWDWWEYDWVEVERSATTGSWTTVTDGRSNAKNGKAWNAWETSVGNSGGSIVPSSTTVSRLSIPNNLVVDMVIDFRGRAWFTEQNPLQSSCDSMSGLVGSSLGNCSNMILDGGYGFTDLSGGSSSTASFFDFDGGYALCGGES